MHLLQNLPRQLDAAILIVQHIATGLASLYKQGAYTIAQDEASCAVFGVPKMAIERGATTQVLPLEQIAEVVCRLFARR